MFSYKYCLRLFRFEDSYVEMRLSTNKYLTNSRIYMKEVYHASPRLFYTFKLNPNRSYPELGNVVFASPYKHFAVIFGCSRYTRDDYCKISTTYRNEDPKNTIQTTLIFKKRVPYEKLDIPVYLYTLNAKNFYKLERHHETEVISNKQPEILNVEKIDSWIEYILSCDKITIKNQYMIKK